jgi:hypothetical protein
MIKAATLAALGLLTLVSPAKPMPRVPVQRRVDTIPLPHIADQLAKAEPKKPVAKRHRAPRKKHICRYEEQDLWGAFLFGVVFTAFLMYVIL